MVSNLTGFCSLPLLHKNMRYIFPCLVEYGQVKLRPVAQVQANYGCEEILKQCTLLIKEQQ